MSTDVVTFNLDGRELPVWTFATWAEMEHFFSTLAPDSYYPTINEQMFHLGITGVVHNPEPEGADATTDHRNAIAVYRITDPS